MNQGVSMNAFRGPMSPSLLPAEFGGKLSLEEPDRELLNDPNLIENYGELLKVKPHRVGEREEESNSGSVVVTGGSPTRNNRYSRGSTCDEGSNASNMVSEDRNSREQEYDYSDSEFEEDLEKRLRDMDTELPGERRGIVNEGTGSVYDGLMMALSDDEDDGEDDDEEEDDEDDDLHIGDDDYDDGVNMELDNEFTEEDDELQPLPPPQELDPDKLYALYPFNGPDPSHCQLKQDESCTLLNDQDPYWWLVRRYDDNKIGFAPAEILETYPERLARLNCWKNENMSPRKNSDTSEEKSWLEEHPATHDNDDNDKGGDFSGYGRSNKSVSFNDVVSYASRYIHDSEEEGDDETDEQWHYDEFSESKHRMDIIGEDEGEEGVIPENMSEATSDASSNTGPMTPLTVEKRRQSSGSSPVQRISSFFPPARAEARNRATQNVGIARDINDSRSSFIEGHESRSEEDAQDGLHKIFEAPVLPFGRNTDSISIGEFSPSSSEWTNDSPREQKLSDSLNSSAIPPSKTIQNLTKIVEAEDNNNNNNSNNNIVKIQRLDSITPDTNDMEEKSRPQQSQRNKETPASSSSSSEEIFMETERMGSSTSVNSTSSIPRQLSHSSSVVSATTAKHHPLIGQLYDPIFHRMDDLLRQIDEVSK